MRLLLRSYEAIKALITGRVTIKHDGIPFHFQNVPFKKILNWILIEASIYVKPSKPWGWPTHFQVEASAFCNLECAVCPVPDGLDRPAGSMSFETFKKIVDEIGDYLFFIILFDWGEPFLNPSIYKMISYAKDRGIKVITSTNGHLFSDPAKVDSMIRSGLDMLVIALDGASQETYQRYRGGGRFETVIEAARTVVERKRLLKASAPFINLRFLVLKQNEHEIEKIKEIADSLGVNALSLKTLSPHLNRSYEENIDAQWEKEAKLLPDNDKYRRFEYKEDRITPVRDKRNKCKQLWNHPSLHWNGTILSCSYDFSDKYPLGDITTDTFESIWYGDLYRNMRSQFRRDWEKLPICHGCAKAYKKACGGPEEVVAEILYYNTNNHDNGQH